MLDTLMYEKQQDSHSCGFFYLIATFKDISGGREDAFMPNEDYDKYHPEKAERLRGAYLANIISVVVEIYDRGVQETVMNCVRFHLQSKQDKAFPSLKKRTQVPEGNHIFPIFTMQTEESRCVVGDVTAPIHDDVVFLKGLDGKKNIIQTRNAIHVKSAWRFEINIDFAKEREALRVGNSVKCLRRDIEEDKIVLKPTNNIFCFLSNKLIDGHVLIGPKYRKFKRDQIYKFKIRLRCRRYKGQKASTPCTYVFFGRYCGVWEWCMEVYNAHNH